MIHTLTLVCHSSADVARLRQILITITNLWSVGARGGPDGSSSYQFGSFSALPIQLLKQTWEVADGSRTA